MTSTDSLKISSVDHLFSHYFRRYSSSPSSSPPSLIISVSLSSAAAPPSVFHKKAGSYSKENYISEIPDFPVVSNVFKKKQDSEQSSAELALEKDDDDDITVEQAWDDIVQRVKFLSADHPLGSHLRATLQRDGERHSGLSLLKIEPSTLKPVKGEFLMADEEKQTLTPKKTIYQRFGVKASYMIEQVHVSSQNTCLYWCHLQIPDFPVVSNVFKKKQDSEQSSAELALEKDDDDDITVEQAWDDIVQRIKFLSSDHPLESHLRTTLQRDGERYAGPAQSIILPKAKTKFVAPRDRT
ncbi:hypothetical protein F2Q70_00031659 [Brassica cretica]|uniref:Uncharacterized protein n=2 Tax=Brassica cretica TaxID=69181 RepID=A0A8S9FTY5_BRACR|nr:hypothetical protein F2Q70_00031659 [Brassica cretica]